MALLGRVTAWGCFAPGGGPSADCMKGWFADLARSAIIGGMPELARTTVSLRIVGDALDPDEITRLLGIEPTGRASKGETHQTASGREVIARCGSWWLDADVPGTLETQIDALLARLPCDPTIWRRLSEHYECDVFCGLFMQEGNEGTGLSPQVMSMLTLRGLRLGLDIYSGSA